VLAARRAGIRRVILPQGNKKDLRDLPDHVRQEMQFHFVDRVEEVLSIVIPNINLKPMALAS
jgi:ATP-dependent Lon protease